MLFRLNDRRITTLAIGTSPLMLMRALIHAQQGDDVRIIDRAPVIGGSWTTPPLLGFTAAECGVHLLENRPDFYDALHALGIALEKDGRCFALWNGRRLHMGSARIVFHALVALNALRRGHFDRFRRIGTSALRSLVHVATPFFYPATGCQQINAELFTRLADRGVHPMFGAETRQIVVDRAYGVRCKIGGEWIEADRVLIGSRAHAPILIDGKEMRLPLEQGRVISLLMRVQESMDTSFSYVELLRDPLLKRVRDVTNFCHPASKSAQAVICIQLRERGYQAVETHGAQAIFDHIVALNLISGQAKLIDSALSNYCYETITDAGLKQLELLANGRILTVRTTDFADGFLSSPPAAQRAGTSTYILASSRA